MHKKGERVFIHIGAALIIVALIFAFVASPHVRAIFGFVVGGIALIILLMAFGGKADKGSSSNPPPSPRNIATPSSQNLVATPAVSVPAAIIPKNWFDDRELVALVQTRLAILNFKPASANETWSDAWRKALQEFAIANEVRWNFEEEIVTFLRVSKIDNLRKRPLIPSFMHGDWYSVECKNRYNVSPHQFYGNTVRTEAGYCEFLSLQGNEGRYTGNVVCKVDNREWTTRVTLEYFVKYIRWSSAAGTANYIRCD